MLAGVVDELGSWSEQLVPSGKFTPNAARRVLAVMAFNLTRAAAIADQLAGEDRWTPLETSRTVEWTNDYSSLLPVLR